MAVQLHDDYPQGTRNGNTCSACGAGHRMIRDEGVIEPRPELVVDFFIQIDFEGFLMLCEQCVLEAAAMLGWVSPAQRNVAIDAAAELIVANGELLHALGQARDLVASLRSYDERESVQADDVPDQPQPVIDADSVLDVVQAPVRKQRTRKAKITA